MSFRFIDLCAGVGGIRLGFESIGWKCVYTSEWDKFAQKTYEANFGTIPHGDLTKISPEDIPSFDALLAGFPCFPRGTLILAKRGLVDIADIKEEDEVLTHLGRWRRVIRHHGSHMASTVCLKGQGHPNMITTANHPFLSTVKHAQNTRRDNKHVIIKTYDEPSWANAEDMKGRFWATPREIETIDRPLSPSLIKDETKFYWCLGRWLADGWTVCYKRKNRPNSVASRILWCSAKHEADELFQNLTNAGIITCRSNEKTVVKFIKQSKELVDFMSPFGKMAYGKTLPSWILTAPKILREAFLMGYFTGDGYKTINGYKATTVSKSIAIGIRLLAVGLGYATTITHTKRPAKCKIEERVVNQRNTWQILIYENSRSSFVLGKHRYGIIRSVEQTGLTQEVFNFEVEEDNSYVADGIVVHNCQPFSKGGLYWNGTKGFDDARGTIFFNIASIIEHHRPSVLFFENVKNLVNHDNGKTFAIIQNILKELGYRVFYKVLNAKDFGVPQSRVRVYIVCFKDNINFVFPHGTKSPTKVGDILETNVDFKYRLTENMWAGHQRRKAKNMVEGKGFGYSMFDENSTHTRTISARYYKDGSEILIKTDGIPRVLTAREAARLQGFPDSFIIPVSDDQAYKQFGNSVAVPVIKAIAKAIENQLYLHTVGAA